MCSTHLSFSCTIGVEGIAEKLNVSLEKGLTGIDFEERAQVFGSNFREEA